MKIPKTIDELVDYVAGIVDPGTMLSGGPFRFKNYTVASDGRILLVRNGARNGIVDISESIRRKVDELIGLLPKNAPEESILIPDLPPLVESVPCGKCQGNGWVTVGDIDDDESAEHCAACGGSGDEVKGNEWERIPVGGSGYSLRYLHAINIDGIVSIFQIDKPTTNEPLNLLVVLYKEGAAIIAPRNI